MQTLPKLSCPGASPLAAPGTPLSPQSMPGLTSRRVGDHRQRGTPRFRCPGPSPTHQPAPVRRPRQARAQNRPGELGPARRPAGLPNCIGGGCSERPRSGLVRQKHTDSALLEIAAVYLFRTSPNGHLPNLKTKGRDEAFKTTRTRNRKLPPAAPFLPVCFRSPESSRWL